MPASDPFFEVPCFPFLRSLPVLGEDCQPGPRQQLNQVTSLIDGSVTYGSSAEVEESLRDKSHGKYIYDKLNAKFSSFSSYQAYCF